MQLAAESEDIALVIVSNTRPSGQEFAFGRRQTQVQTFEGRLRNGGANVEDVRDRMRQSAMPGTSRHHWGTDIDLAVRGSENRAFQASSWEEGNLLLAYNWLSDNAASFGFYQTYTSKEDDERTGYEEEPWHWSFMPSAADYLDSYNENISNGDLTGFEGDQFVNEINPIGEYVNGLPENLLNFPEEERIPRTEAGGYYAYRVSTDRGDDLRVRDEPTVAGNIIGRIPNGQTFYPRSLVESPQGTWGLIREGYYIAIELDGKVYARSVR